MPRAPKTAIEKDIRDDFEKVDMLTRERKYYLFSRTDALVDQHFKDLDWFFTQKSFTVKPKQITEEFNYEVRTLHTPERVLWAIKKMRKYKENIERSIGILEEAHAKSMR